MFIIKTQMLKIKNILEQNGSCLRYALLIYSIASMAFTQTLSIEEMFLRLNIPIWLAFFLSLGIVPLVSVFYFCKKQKFLDNDKQKNINDLRILYISILSMIAWSLMYFFTGWITKSRHMHTMLTPMDSIFPYIPESIFIYFTVYHAFVIPLLLQDSPKKTKKIALMALSIVGVDFLIMMIYPVTMNRPAPKGPYLTQWFMNLLHGSDPAHNCFPSSHCGVALFAFLTALKQKSKFLSLFLGISWILISLSTLTTRQHYFVDVIAGWGITLVIYGIFTYNDKNIGGYDES